MGGWEASTLHRDFASREPQSWAESLQFYKHAQINRPFSDDQYQKPRRVTRYEMSRKEAAYNPVTQSWRDEAREAAMRKEDAESTLVQQNRAKDRQLAFERSTHDVLNHERRRTGLPDPQAELGLTFPVSKREQRLAHPMDSMVPYNIISGLSVEDHHWTPPDQRPKVPLPKEDTKLRSVTQQPREYNIVSNMYKRDHEEKTATEAERKRRVAAEKFWATHDYNIMTQRFYDAAKEERYQRLKKASEVWRVCGFNACEQALVLTAAPVGMYHSIVPQLQQPTKQFTKLPASYQSGEGYVYSITNFSVQNPKLYRDFEESEKRAIESKAHKWVREAEIVERAEERAQIEQERAEKRPSHARYQVRASRDCTTVTWAGGVFQPIPLCPEGSTYPKTPPPVARTSGAPQDSTSHGYDIVTNKGYHDKDPAPLAPARTVPRPTEWENLTRSSNTFWQTRSGRMPGQSLLRPASEGAEFLPPLRGRGAENATRVPVPALDISRTRGGVAEQGEQPPLKLELTSGSSDVRTGGFQ